MKTLLEYDAILAECRDLFEAKTRDYGTSWRINRLPSFTDQLYIKACRIRNIESSGTHKVEEGVRPEFIGLINYSIMTLIQVDLGVPSEDFLDSPSNLALQDTLHQFDLQVAANRSLLANKNHDYGEAWREMRPSSLTDMILVKLLRIKQIEDNGGQAMVSEGVEGGYRDIINYAVFALIRHDEQSKNP